LGSCPESLVARGQARLFGVAGSNPPGSVSISLFDSSVSVFLIACGVITPRVLFFFIQGRCLEFAMAITFEEMLVLCVYAGLRQGLEGMRVGGRRSFVVPAGV